MLRFSRTTKAFLALLALISAGIGMTIWLQYAPVVDGSVRSFNREVEYYNLEPLIIGGAMPSGPGDLTFAPYLNIPASQKFYVSIAEPSTWCINEECGLDGALIQTLGGWLQVENTYQPEYALSFGLDLPEHKNITSLVVVGDDDGRIVGLYPNKGLKDVISILRNHPELADFSLLLGVKEFHNLKVGDLSPLKPGDSISEMSDELQKKLSTSSIPKGKKFYIYALQKRRYDVVGMYGRYENKYACIPEVGCRYPEPDPPHDFLFDTIDTLDGWFLANDVDNTAMIELFGMDSQEILRGTSSLVVVTDAKGIIVSLHPQKTMSDALSILSQHPELADTQEWH